MDTPPSPPLIVITDEMVREHRPDLLALIAAELAGERPGCACRPWHAWPDGPVVGYVELCPAHATARPRGEGCP